MSAGKVAVIAKITSLPGKRDELAKALDIAFDNVKTEAGTLYYILHADNADETVLWMYEMYTGQEALESHMGSQWFKEWGPSLAPFLGGRPELIFVTPLAGKGL